MAQYINSEPQPVGGAVTVKHHVLKYIHTDRSTEVHTDSPAEEESVTQHSEGLQPFILSSIHHVYMLIRHATDTSAKMREAGIVTEGL